MKGKTRVEKGITLIALIITIVVLLILAVVAISSITNDGILSYATNAANSYNQAAVNEQEALQGYLNFLNNGGLEDGNNGGNAEGYEEVTLAVAITDDMYDRTENSQTSDIYGNIIKIPAGFKILVDDTTVYTGVTDIDVAKGIVIIDEAGNEFVYVPVGSIKTASGTKNLQLARYEFDILTYDETGTPTGFGGTGAITETHTLATDQIVDPMLTLMGLDCYFVEGEIEGIDNQRNGYALNIEDFIIKASSGYYIGRYEARTNSTTARASGDALTSVTLNKANAVYNYIAQPDAINVCQNMYTNKPFEIDLVNSFAWDTTIVFIQTFEDSNYSIEQGGNYTYGYKITGTVGQNKEDKVCNIYDMACNLTEWSTETNSKSEIPYTPRGAGTQDLNVLMSSTRISPYDVVDDVEAWNAACTFRPILYL